MKKIFAALCALLLVPTMASAGGERISLSELKAQTPAAVEGTHEAYGRTISFRAPVYVPDVDTLPILRVKRTCISAQTAEALGDSLEKNTLYGQRAAMRPGGLAESEASHFTAYVQNLWTSAADEAAIFAPNQENSCGTPKTFWRGKRRRCSANSKSAVCRIARVCGAKGLCATARKKAGITSRRGKPCAAYRL